MSAILIVDDSLTARFKLAALLSDKGYTITEAKNGREALEILEKENPDCILLDLLMPELDGLGVLEELKQRQISIPVIVLTADIQDTTREKCLSYGIIGFLNKPLKNNDTLFELVEKAINAQ